MNRTEAQLPLSKRLLAVFFSLVLVVGLVPTSAWAEGEGEQGSETQEQTDAQGNPAEEVSSDNGGGTTDVVTSDQGGDSDVDGNSSDQNGDENEPAADSGENGIAAASLIDNGSSVDDGSAVYEYDKQMTNGDIYDKLNQVYGSSPYQVYVYDGDGNEKTSLTIFNKSKTFPILNKGKSTYTVKWRSFEPLPKDHTRSLIVQQNLKVDDPSDCTYNGEEQKWVPTVKDTNDPSNVLKEGTDYTVTYTRGDTPTDNFTDVGTIYVKINGKKDLTCADPYDYTYLNETKVYTINQAPVTVTADAASKTYGESDPTTFTASVEGTYNGDTVDYSVERKVPGEDAKTYENAIVPSGEASQGNYSVTYVPAAFTINQAKATVKADAASKTYGKDDPAFTAQVEGMVSGESSDLIHYTVTRTNTDENADTYKGVIVPSGEASQGNYSVEYVSADFTINKAGNLSLDVSNAGYEGTYDGQEHGGAAEPSDKNGTTVEYCTGDPSVESNWSTDVPKVKDVDEVTVHARAKNPNYSNVPTAEYTLKVKQAQVTVTADAASKTYGKDDPAFTAQVEGVVSGESAADLIKYTVDRMNIDEDAGLYEYVIIPEGESSQGNYTVEYVPANFIINRAEDLSLDVSNAGYKGTYDGQEHGGAAVTNDPYNTAKIEYCTGDPDVEDNWSTDVPKVKDVADVTVKVRATSKNYTKTAYAEYSLNVTPAQVTVSVKGKTDTVTYDGTEHSVSGFEMTGISGEATEYYSPKSIVLVGGNEAKATNASTTYMGLEAADFDNTDDNYKVTFNVESDGWLKIDPAEITVNVKGNTNTVTYDGEKQQVTGFTATASSELYDTKNVVLKAGCSDIAEGADAGTYTMGLTADSFTNADDNFSVVKWNFEGDGGITIEKRAIQVSDSASVEYNGQEQVLDIDASKVTNLVDGDRLYLFGAQVKGTEPGTYTDVTDYTWDVVNDELNVTKNYDLTVAGELTITKADSGSNGSSADNGTKASDNASSDGSSTTKTGDTALPFGVAAAAAAAALAAFAATRKLRSMKR